LEFSMRRSFRPESVKEMANRFLEQPPLKEKKMKPVGIGVLIAIIVLTMSCGLVPARYTIIDEHPLGVTIGKYNHIHVGWLDLDENEWQILGYETKERWRMVISENYKDGLQVYLKNLLPEKKFNFDALKSSATPGESELSITFTDSKVEKRSFFSFDGHDYIQTTIHFADVKEGKEIYKASVKASSRGLGPQQYSFEGRLGFATRNLAEMISGKLK